MPATLRATSVAIAALLVLGQAVAGGAGGPSLLYELVDLGIEGPRHDGALFSEALGINEAGVVVGHTSPGHAFVWTRSGGRQVLPALGPNDIGHVSATAYDINNKGAIVGASTAPGLDHRRATLWPRDRRPMNLGILGPPPFRGMLGSVANAINDGGEVVGESTSAPAGYNHAFRWTAASGMQDLGVLGGDQFGNAFSRATDINKRGVIVGRSTIDAPNEVARAVSWTRRGGPVDIAPSLDYSDAWAINDRSWVAGSAIDLDVSGAEAALLWAGSLRILNLGTGPVGFDGGEFAHAFGVSEAGHVVGTMSSPTHPFAAAFLWTRATGTKVDLNDLLDETGAGWRVVRAEDVNRKGEIVGSGCQIATGCEVQRAFVLRPVRAR